VTYIFEKAVLYRKYNMHGSEPRQPSMSQYHSQAAHSSPISPLPFHGCEKIIKEKEMKLAM